MRDDLQKVILQEHQGWDDSVVDRAVFGTTDAAEIAALLEGFCERELGARVIGARFYRVSVACVAVGLIDFNPSVQRFHLDRCKAYLDFAFELGARNLLLVLGEYIWNREVIPPAEQWATAVKHLKTLGDHADKLGADVRNFANAQHVESTEKDLNQRSAQYFGRVVVVEEAISGGRGRVRVGDTLWQASGADAPKGAQVRITGANGTVFVVEPA